MKYKKYELKCHKNDSKMLSQSWNMFTEARLGSLEFLVRACPKFIFNTAATLEHWPQFGLDRHDINFLYKSEGVVSRSLINFEAADAMKKH